MSDDSIYAAFVRAMEANKVVDNDWGRRFSISKIERRRNWTMESYHFGDLLDPGNPYSLLGSTVPMAERDLRRVTTAYTVTVYGVPNVLIKRMGVADYPDDDELPRYYAYALASDGVWESVFPGNLIPLILKADRLLVDREIIEVEPRPKVRLTRPSLSSGRVLPGTTIIHLKRRVYPVGPTLRPGSVRCPHERRSHVRRLRSGKVVTVRSSSIRGGTGRPRAYEVRK